MELSSNMHPDYEKENVWKKKRKKLNENDNIYNYHYEEIKNKAFKLGKKMRIQSLWEFCINYSFGKMKQNSGSGIQL